jgi:ribonuclease P protein component
VVRNRIRRRLRAIFDEVLSVEPSPPLASAMVIVLPGAHGLSFPDLQKQVLELMKKIEKSSESTS